MPLHEQGHFLVPKVVIHRNTVYYSPKTVDKLLRSYGVIHNSLLLAATPVAAKQITLFLRTVDKIGTMAL